MRYAHIIGIAVAQIVAGMMVNSFPLSMGGTLLAAYVLPRWGEWRARQDD